MSWDALRRCWAATAELSELAPDWTREQAQAELKRRAAAHRVGLDQLVTAGEMAPSTADHLQLAFEEVAFHRWRGHSSMTCYRPSPAGIALMKSRDTLVHQLELLAELAQKVELYPQTVAKAQAAVEREFSFLAAMNKLGEVTLDQNQLAQQYQAGRWEGNPLAADAAQCLVALLLGEGS